MLWEDLDDDLSGRYYRAARYRHADPEELEGALASYVELFAPLREGLVDDDLEAAQPSSMRPSNIPAHSPFGALTSDDEGD